jgi:hypothetical protein
LYDDSGGQKIIGTSKARISSWGYLCDNSKHHFSILNYEIAREFFFHPWFNHIFISTALLGVSAGVLCRLSENTKRWDYLLIGLFAGLLAGLSHYLTTFVITIIAIFLSKSSMDIAMLFDRFVTPLVDGTAQSVVIWCIVLAERNRLQAPDERGKGL